MEIGGGLSNLLLTNTGINATMATVNKHSTLIGVNNSNLSDEDKRSKAAPACTCIKEGGATPTNVPQKKAPIGTPKWGEPRFTVQLGGKGDILNTIM